AGERAPRAGDPATAGQRDVRLTPDRGEVATRPPGEWPQRARRAQDEQPTAGSHSERAVTARPRQIDHSRDMPATNPVPRQPGAGPAGPAGVRRARRPAPARSEEEGPHTTAFPNAPTLRSHRAQPAQPGAPRIMAAPHPATPHAPFSCGESPRRHEGTHYA